MKMNDDSSQQLVEVIFREDKVGDGRSAGEALVYSQKALLSEGKVRPLATNAIDAILQAVLKSKLGDTGFLPCDLCKTADVIDFGRTKRPILLHRQVTAEYYMGVSSGGSESEIHFWEEGVLLLSRSARDRYGAATEGVDVWLLSGKRLAFIQFAEASYGGGTVCASEFDKREHTSQPPRIVQYDAGQGFFRVLA